MRIKNWLKKLSFGKIAYARSILGLLVFNLVIISLVIILNNCLPPEVPLFYGLPIGEEQLTKSMFLILPPVVAIIFTIINSVAVNVIKDDFVQKTLLAITLFVSLLTSITVIKIILLINSC